MTAPAPFTLAYVPGVMPAKWVRTWQERSPGQSLDLVQTEAADAADRVLSGQADAAFLRLPTARDGLHAIPLYTETTVVVTPKDHLLTAADELTAEDLTDELVLHPHDDVLDWQRPPGREANERPATTADAIALVAAGVGLLVVPQSLARLHHRRDLTYRPLTDAPQSQVALSWLEDQTTDDIERLIGVIRGRTVNSTRGRPAETPRERPTRKQPSRATGAKKGKPRKR